MRNGDFRGLVDSQGRQITLYDPFTTDPVTWQRQPLTYNGIPNMINPARITKVAKFLFDATPLPNLPNVNPLVDFNWVGPDADSHDAEHHFDSHRPSLQRQGPRLRTVHLRDERPLARHYGDAAITLGDYPNTVATSNRHWPNHHRRAHWVRTFLHQ